MVADLFGYHALQLGCPVLDALRNSRIPHRWMALGVQDPSSCGPDALFGNQGAWHRLALYAEPLALPFAPQSLDLLVLPHALEASPDPHAVLREAERVLVPEGRVVIIGFNPLSAWGVHVLRAQLCARWGGDGRSNLPSGLQLVGAPRVRDWLRLLNFEVESARFGGYVPAVSSSAWLERWRWLDTVGERWWPVFGGIYLLVAVKRVHGMRLLGPAWRTQPVKRPSLVVPVARR